MCMNIRARCHSGTLTHTHSLPANRSRIFIFDKFFSAIRTNTNSMRFRSVNAHMCVGVGGRRMLRCRGNSGRGLC